MTALEAGLTVYAVLVTLWGVNGAWDLTRMATRLDAAQERLLAAWKDGAVIPPAAEPVTVEEDPVPEFPPILEEYIQSFEGDFAQKKWRSRVRTLMVLHNQNIQKVLVDLESPNYGR